MALTKTSCLKLVAVFSAAAVATARGDKDRKRQNYCLPFHLIKFFISSTLSILRSRITNTKAFAD
jgi:hypothetical protein